MTSNETSSLIRSFARSTSGTISSEHALIAAVTALIVVGIAPLIGAGVAALFSVI